MTPTFPETRLLAGDLLLRPFSAIDIEENQIACADPLVQHWLPLPRPYTRQDSADWCTKISHSLRETGDGIHFAIVDANTDRLLGAVGLKKTDWRGLVSEIGYSVAPWARGRGIAAEATRTIGHWLLVDHSFQRMELKAATGNLASQRTALQAGLQREGIMRNAGFIHAGRVDLVLFSLTPDDLKSRYDGDPTQSVQRRQPIMNLMEDQQAPRPAEGEGEAKVITLCGSTKFEAEFAEVNQRLTMEGCVVISLGMFRLPDLPDYDWTADSSDLKARLGGVHFQKIRMADEVYIVDLGGYVGESTRREIAYAESLGKPVRYLSRERSARTGDRPQE